MEEEVIFEPERCQSDSSRPYTLEELLAINEVLIGRSHRHPTVSNLCKRLINAQADLPRVKTRTREIPEETFDAPAFSRIPPPALKKHKTLLRLPNVQYLSDSHGIEDLYRLEQVGKGAFGTVYRGVSYVGGPQVAVKEMDVSGLDRQKLREIRKELTILKEASSHCGTHVNELYDVLFDSKKEKLYLILEFLDGVEMFEFFKDRRKYFQDDYYATLSMQLVEGFQCLHAANIAHRDIKLENIMLVDNNQRAVIIDFGLSCLKACHAGMVGSPATIAPEVFFGMMDETSVDNWKRADIWSLGCSLYEMILPEGYPLQNEFVDIFFSTNDPDERTRRYTKLVKSPQNVLQLKDNFPRAEYPKMYNILDKMLVLDPYARTLMM